LLYIFAGGAVLYQQKPEMIW